MHYMNEELKHNAHVSVTFTLAAAGKCRSWWEGLVNLQITSLATCLNPFHLKYPFVRSYVLSFNCTYAKY